jgi:hypothetical protein
MTWIMGNVSKVVWLVVVLLGWKLVENDRMHHQRIKYCDTMSKIESVECECECECEYWRV